MKKKQSWDAQNTATTRLVVITLTVLAATIIWLTSYFVNPKSTNPSDNADRFPGNGVAEQGQLPGKTEQEIMEQMQREADEGIFAFKINSRPVFATGGSEGSLRIENPAFNVYPFVVRIFLNSTNEEIYNSGGILPNHHINSARLTTVLPEGKHAATAYIHVYDPETSEFEGKAAVELTLIVGAQPL